VDVIDGKAQGEPRLVKSDIGDIGRGLGFTRRGAYYYNLSVSTGGDIHVVELNPETGRIQEKPAVLATRFGNKLEPAWSPDGRRLAFYRRTGPDSWAPGWRTLYLRSGQTGEERELRNDLILYGGIQWFPDGRSLLVSACRDRRDFRIDYFRMDVETGATSLLMQREDGAGTFWPGLSPDGKTIFFTYYEKESGKSYSGPGDCFLGSYQIETGPEKELCPIPPRDQGARSDVPVSPQRARQSIAVSPDGRQVAFVVHEGPWPVTSVVKTIDPENGQLREVFRSPWPGFIPGNQGLEWTPDGHHLLIVRGSMSTEIGELLRVPAKGGKAQEVGLTGKSLSSPSIHPDGRHLAFRAGSDDSNEVWVMENFLKAGKGKDK
jgi:Tol biopolymer transport system component